MRDYNNLAKGYFRGTPAEYIAGHNSAKQIVGGAVRCSKCGVTRPTADFYRDSSRALGFDCWCKACRRANVKRWEESPQGKKRGRAYSAERRGQKSKRFVESVDPLVVYARGRGVCGICGQPTEPDNFHVDHIIPLARDGEHSYANAQIAHPICNSRKGTKLMEELCETKA